MGESKLPVLTVSDRTFSNDRVAPSIGYLLRSVKGHCFMSLVARTSHSAQPITELLVYWERKAFVTGSPHFDVQFRNGSRANEPKNSKFQTSESADE